MSAYVKVPKHSLQNKFEISMRKKYQKMEVSKFLYFNVIDENRRMANVFICTCRKLCMEQTSCVIFGLFEYAGEHQIQ